MTLVDKSPSVAPHEFTSISFPVKILKILLHDIQSSGDAATITAQNATVDVDSDDGVSTFIFFLTEYALTA
jgi:hypothetical protein